MSMKYECWSYKDGKPFKLVYVTANSKSEAEQIAWQKFRDMGISPEKVNCS